MSAWILDLNTYNSRCSGGPGHRRHNRPSAVWTVLFGGFMYYIPYTDAAVFNRRERLERVIRLFLITSSALAVGLLILLALFYGSGLEYRYEVVVILIDWIALIVSGVLLSVLFKRAGRHKTSRLPGSPSRQGLANSV